MDKEQYANLRTLLKRLIEDCVRGTDATYVKIKYSDLDTAIKNIEEVLKGRNNEKV